MNAAPLQLCKLLLKIHCSPMFGPALKMLSKFGDSRLDDWQLIMAGMVVIFSPKLWFSVVVFTFRLSLTRFFIKVAAISLNIIKSFLFLLVAGNYISFTMLCKLLLSAYRLSYILFIAFFLCYFAIFWLSKVHYYASIFSAFPYLSR